MIGIILFIILIFAIIYAIAPKISLSLVNKLFVYHSYTKKEMDKSKFNIFKNRVIKVISTYTYLGILIGLIFYFVGIGFLSSSEIVMDNKLNLNREGIFFASFIIYFSFVFVLRVVTLMNKTYLVSFIPPLKNIIHKLNISCNYKQQIDYIRSFLFSVLLVALTGTSMFFLIQIVLNPSYSIDINIGKVIIVPLIKTIILFTIFVIIISTIGELILCIPKIGVHEEYIKNYPEY